MMCHKMCHRNHDTSILFIDNTVNSNMLDSFTNESVIEVGQLSEDLMSEFLYVVMYWLVNAKNNNYDMIR